MDSLMQRAKQGPPTVGGEPAPYDGAAPENEGAPETAAEGGQEEGGGEPFKRPDISRLIPPEQRDAVDRIVAAAQKLMYSPDMKEELMAEIHRDTPVPQKMAEAVVGLLLTMDKQSKGGLPSAAIPAAGQELLGEAAEVLIAAGQPVTMDDYVNASQLMFVLLAKKMKIPDEQIAAVGKAGAPPQGAPPQGMPGMPPQGMPPGAMQ